MPAALQSQWMDYCPWVGAPRARRSPQLCWRLALPVAVGAKPRLGRCLVALSPPSTGSKQKQNKRAHACASTHLHLHLHLRMWARVRVHVRERAERRFRIQFAQVVDSAGFNLHRLERASRDTRSYMEGASRHEELSRKGSAEHLPETICAGADSGADLVRVNLFWKLAARHGSAAWPASSPLYRTDRGKCRDTGRHTCERPGHPCLRRISSGAAFLHRGALLRMGRAWRAAFILKGHSVATASMALSADLRSHVEKLRPPGAERCPRYTLPRQCMTGVVLTPRRCTRWSSGPGCRGGWVGSCSARARVIFGRRGPERQTAQEVTASHSAMAKRLRDVLANASAARAGPGKRASAGAGSPPPATSGMAALECGALQGPATPIGLPPHYGGTSPTSLSRRRCPSACILLWSSC